MTRESLLKRKDQYSLLPFTNKFSSAGLNTKNTRQAMLTSRSTILSTLVRVACYDNSSTIGGQKGGWEGRQARRKEDRMDRVAVGKTGKQTVCPKGRQAGEKASRQKGRQI